MSDDEMAQTLVTSSSGVQQGFFFFLNQAALSAAQNVTTDMFSALLKPSTGSLSHECCSAREKACPEGISAFVDLALWSQRMADGVTGK